MAVLGQGGRLELRREAPSACVVLPQDLNLGNGSFEIGCDVYEFEYPGRLNNCEGCHITPETGNPGTYYPFDPATRFATTVDIGDRADLTDDVAISPNSAVCSSCHPSDLAREHMRQNGGDFDARKSAFGELISSGVETCQLCHGPGRTADVKEMHGVGTFQFN